MWYVRITMEMTVAIKARALSISSWIHLESSEGCSKTFKYTAFTPRHTKYCLSPPLTSILTFVCFYLWVYHLFWHEMWWDYWSVFSLEYSVPCRLSLLTVDNHIDVFDIRRGDVVAGFAFITTRLVSHDTYNVQVLLSIQRFCCREGEKKGGIKIMVIFNPYFPQWLWTNINLLANNSNIGDMDFIWILWVFVLY